MEERRLGVWGKYLTLWVAICIGVGTALGRLFPQISDGLARVEVAHIPIPIFLCLFAMIYPIMVQISFEEIKRAALNPKPILLTLFANWAVKPFTMALFAWFFLSVVFGNFHLQIMNSRFFLARSIMSGALREESFLAIHGRRCFDIRGSLN